jgi:hypothetical protein
MTNKARRSDHPLVSGDGKYRWNGQWWVPSTSQPRPHRLTLQPDAPQQGAGFVLPTWMVLLLGLIVGLGVLWVVEPEFFTGW